jgi:hypothetical protein
MVEAEASRRKSKRLLTDVRDFAEHPSPRCAVLTSYLPARIITPARIAAGIRVDDSKGRQSGFSEDRESIRERG